MSLTCNTQSLGNSIVITNQFLDNYRINDGNFVEEQHSLGGIDE